MGGSPFADSAASLGARDVHVWRIGLARDASAYLPVLSHDERDRARKFHFDAHRDAFVVAHGMVRTILGAYAGVAPRELSFVTTGQGKPSLVGANGVRFNLSHSGALALLAIAHDREVGVDVERWDTSVEHLALAEYCFSPLEQTSLRALGDTDRVAGFFAAWSRKEAYLKATGHGVSRGLDHFDVTLDIPARILDDRLEGAVSRWSMHDLAVGEGYSAAVVAELPVDRVHLFSA